MSFFQNYISKIYEIKLQILDNAYIYIVQYEAMGGEGWLPIGIGLGNRAFELFLIQTIIDLLLQEFKKPKNH